MTPSEQERLTQHVAQIAAAFVKELRPDNSIHSAVTEDSYEPDAVAAHHFINLLALIDGGLFSTYSRGVFSWLSDPKHLWSGHPFTLDSYSRAAHVNEKNDEIFRKSIVDKQLADGSIPVYCAFVGGGDFFSTLWSAKILAQYSSAQFEGVLERAIVYLVDRFTIAASSPAQKGFLLFVLIETGAWKKHKGVFDQLAAFVMEKAAGGNWTCSLLECIDEFYLLDDLVSLWKATGSQKALDIVERRISEFFELEEVHIPKALARWNGALPRSPYYQLLLRSAYVSARVLRERDNSAVAFCVNDLIHNQFRQIYYDYLAKQDLLREYIFHFGESFASFKSYNDDLKRLWSASKSTYERSIFLMMPFENKELYGTTAIKVKEACEVHGYDAFRLDDKGRRPMDTLWDNLVLNMLACKYGIAVYISTTAREATTDENRFFENPNVAMEFGFMKSRGKKILILKDKKSKLPSDLQGFQWKEFDLDNPTSTVPQAVASWLNELKEGDRVQS